MEIDITTISFRGKPFSYKQFARFLRDECDDLLKYTCEEKWWGPFLFERACKAHFGKCPKRNIILKKNLITIMKVYLDQNEQTSENIIKNLIDLSFFSVCDYYTSEPRYAIINIG